jgi:HEAT repeat protein
MGLFSWLAAKTAKTAALEPSAGSAPDAEDEGALAGQPAADLVETLSSGDGGLRVDAARALVERWRAGDAEAAAALAPRLGGLLEDADPLLRLAGLSGFRLLRKPENLEKDASTVIGLLNDPSAQVRTAAVGAVARIPGDAARGQLRALLSSAEEPMRFQAACVLADLRDSAALPALTAALDEDIRRQEALSALLSLGDAAAIPAVVALFEHEATGTFDRTMAAAALAGLGDARGGDHLAERIAAGEDDSPVAAEMAGRLRVEAAVPALAALADEEGAPARGAALRALGRLRAPGAQERLLALSVDPDTADDLRMDAAEGLAEVGTPEALSCLQELAGAGSELGQLCQDLLREVAANAAAGAAAAGGDTAAKAPR